MLEKWTGELVGAMHMAGVTKKQLAESVGWNDKYLSVVLNGHKNPKGAKEKLFEALNRLIAEHSEDTSLIGDKDTTDDVQ